MSDNEIDDVPAGALVLAEWETRHFTWQAVGRTREEALAALRTMWADWCGDARGTGADPDLLFEAINGGDINYRDLSAGAIFQDWEPYHLAPVNGTVNG